MTTSTPPKKNNWSWRSQAFRGLVYQIIAAMVIVMAGWFLVHNTLENMRSEERRGGKECI